MCSNKKAAFRRPGQYVKKMHNSSDDVRVFLAIPKIIVEHAFETNYRKMLLHLYLCRREHRAGVHLDIASACKSVRRRHCSVTRR
jgi:hypothetical protein